MVPITVHDESPAVLMGKLLGLQQSCQPLPDTRIPLVPVNEVSILFLDLGSSACRENICMQVVLRFIGSREVETLL